MCGDNRKTWGAILGGPVGLLAGKISYDMDKAADEQKKELAQMKADQDKALAEANKPAPVTIDPVVDPDTKRKKLTALRAGILSTIKTSPMGATSITGKTKLGQ